MNASLLVVLVLSGQIADAGGDDICNVVETALAAKTFARGVEREVALIESNVRDVWPEGRQVPVVVGTGNVPSRCSSKRYVFVHSKPKGLYLGLDVRFSEGRWWVAAQVRSAKAANLMYGMYCVSMDRLGVAFRGEYSDAGCGGMLRW
ncbi:MAG: hypothetical protein JNJ54_25885 [Myxococcaceae bacterium]|nr:hypothetical protein [Myxococcaceae bacterium]